MELRRRTVARLKMELRRRRVARLKMELRRRRVVLGTLYRKLAIQDRAAVVVRHLAVLLPKRVLVVKEATVKQL